MKNGDTKPNGKREPTAPYYRHSFRGAKLDIYRILLVYGITHPAQQHAIKKLLRAGKGVKSLERDIQEVIDSLERWREMIQEDDAAQTGNLNIIRIERRTVKAGRRK